MKRMSYVFCWCMPCKMKIDFEMPREKGLLQMCTVPSVPRLPRKPTVDVTLCHACHVKPRWMSGCPTPATQSAAASQAPKPDQARHPVPSVPRLPRKTTVDVTLCHACHVKPRWMSGCATPATQSAAASQAPKPDQARHPVPSAPRLPRETTVDVTLCHACPRETKVDVRLCHACHAKCRCVCVCMCVYARKTTVDVTLCHACHVKPRWMSGCATPATQSAAASQAPKPDQARHPVPSAPRLPRETTVDVTLCHACHVKPRWMSGCATPATQSAAVCVCVCVCVCVYVYVYVYVCVFFSYAPFLWKSLACATSVLFLTALLKGLFAAAYLACICTKASGVLRIYRQA